MADQDISKLRVVDLKQELRIRGLKVTGNKNELAARLQSATGSHIKEFNYQKERSAKKRRLNHGIFKMPVEIIEYIFDYLNLKDLSAVSGTCKRMQQLAGRVYQQNYSGLVPSFSRSKENWNFRRSKYDYDIDFEHFIPFIDKMCCAHKRSLLDSQSKFDQLKKLTLHDVDLRFVQIDGMNGILSKLEHLQMVYCSMKDNFLENLLVRAPNLKRLYLFYSAAGQRWLKRSYPTLELCEASSTFTMPLEKFLACNPNIRRFGIEARNLWKIRKRMNASVVKLDELTIYFGDYVSKIEQVSVWQLLNEYRQLGFYKRLNLFFFGSLYQIILDGIPNIIKINRLTVSRRGFFLRVALSGLTHLEDISYSESNVITDIEDVANKFENLKFIHFGVSNTSHVKLFMGRSARLEKIRIDWFKNGAGNIEHEKIINLIELNQERARLANANKVTLFVQEPVYLATKRAKRETDLDFIKLKRTDTLNDREFEFSYAEESIIRSNYIIR